jgi:hypothetical protein
MWNNLAVVLSVYHLQEWTPFATWVLRLAPPHPFFLNFFVSLNTVMRVSDCCLWLTLKMANELIPGR